MILNINIYNKHFTMKQVFLFILITVILLLLSSCATYRDVERYNEPVEPYFYYNQPVYFDTFYYWKGYYNHDTYYHWTPIKPTPKKK